MTETHQGLLDFTQRYISERANIDQLLTELANPEILDNLVEEFDTAVTAVNNFSSGGNRTKFPNTAEIRKLLGTQSLPTIKQMEEGSNFGNLRAGVRAFRTADELMRKGENQEQGSKWEFHRDMKDPKQLAASLLLEIYGKFLEAKLPEVATLKDGGFKVVLALEEMIARDNEQYPQLFNAVRQWYSVDEGFSPALVADLQSVKA